MTTQSLDGKTVLITGSAHRIGRALALACARAGANVIVHHEKSRDAALELQGEIEQLGPHAWTLQADLRDGAQVTRLMEEASSLSPLYALVNNASIFKALSLEETTLQDWEQHFAVNLTAPFLLSQAFSRHVEPSIRGRIVNLLDWRALRPGADHFPYTATKAALAALTRSLAAALAPGITVNGLALGAILPPKDGGDTSHIIEKVPAKEWGSLDDVSNALLFLLTQADYVTGEIIHVDGGRHLI